MKVTSNVLKIMSACGLLILFFVFGYKSGLSPENPGRVGPHKKVDLKTVDAEVKAQLIGQSVAGHFDEGKVNINQNQFKNLDSEDFQVQLKTCLDKTTDKSLNDFIESLIVDSVSRSETLFENYHFSLSNGTERRIQISPREGETSGGVRVLKLFSVDAENLPIPEKVPKAIRSLPIAQQISRLSEGREPFYSQVRERLTLKNGDNLEIEWKQNKVNEFQWTGEGFLFSCATGASCHCSH